MKWIKSLVVFMFVAVFLSGCYCRKCWGQSPTPTPVYPINSDLVIDASEYAEFERTVLEACNNEDYKAISAILFKVATGAKIPSATTTVTINQAQFNRWFNPADNGSFLSLTQWSLTNTMLKKKRLPEPLTLQRAKDMAQTKIQNTSKRQRFFALIEGITTPMEEF